jgi:hypothetical protein
MMCELERERCTVSRIREHESEKNFEVVFNRFVVQVCG